MVRRCDPFTTTQNAQVMGLPLLKMTAQATAAKCPSHPNRETRA
ncbi:MAG: hypothetical protein ACLUI3_00800 [Christensenellales bacterium]